MRKDDVLDEGTQRTKGVDALTSNIEAAKAVSELVKTTLGPMGMDKMLIDGVGNTIVTNDGVKILKEMEITHPGAKLLVDVAKTQEAEVGDGTTTAVILSGELLKKAQELLGKNIHPTTITRVYKQMSQKALTALKSYATPLNESNKTMLNHIVETAMTGKVAEHAKTHLASLLFELSKELGASSLSKDHIKIQKAAGGTIEESSLIKGVVLDKEPAHPNMPSSVKKASILLVNFPLEVRELDTDAKVNLNSLQEYEAFVQAEQTYLLQIAQRIKEVGATVVICQKGIDDTVAYYLAREGILALRRSRKSDLEKLSRALQVPIVTHEDDIMKRHLGAAATVEIKELLGEKYVFVEGCKDPKAMTLFLRSSTVHVLDEVERAVEDALGDLNVVLKSKKVVAGGGAVELALYQELQKSVKRFSGKERLVAQAYAQSFLIIPTVLCQNSGLDELEVLTTLQSKHEKNKKNAGISSDEGIVDDTFKMGIVEPINVKQQAIFSATEISALILRIDDIIAAKTLTPSQDEDMF